MYWIVSAFTSLVVQTLGNKSCFRKCSWVVASVKLLTERSVLFNVLLYQLIHTQVKYVILNSDVAACGVNLKTLFMIYNDYFGRVNVSKGCDR
jgi:hypothetical protein